MRLRNLHDNFTVCPLWKFYTVEVAMEYAPKSEHRNLKKKGPEHQVFVGQGDSCAGGGGNTGLQRKTCPNSTAWSSTTKENLTAKRKYAAILLSVLPFTFTTTRLPRIHPQMGTPFGACVSKWEPHGPWVSKRENSIWGIMGHLGHPSLNGNTIRGNCLFPGPFGAAVSKWEHHLGQSPFS